MSRLILIVNKEDLNDKPAETLIGTLITKDGKVIKTESDGGIFPHQRKKTKMIRRG